MFFLASVIWEERLSSLEKSVANLAQFVLRNRLAVDDASPERPASSPNVDP